MANELTYDALACGLVSWIVPDKELEDRATDIAGRLSKAPREASALSKSIMRLADQRGETAVDRFHFTAHQISHHTNETGQVFEAYLAASRSERGNQ